MYEVKCDVCGKWEEPEATLSIMNREWRLCLDCAVNLSEHLDRQAAHEESWRAERT